MSSLKVTSLLTKNVAARMSYNLNPFCVSEYPIKTEGMALEKNL